MLQKKDTKQEQAGQDYQYRLYYESCETEGECLLQSVVPVYIHKPFFTIYVIFSILLVGIPLLITYWYPWLKRKLYYRPCALADATYFHVVNYDGISTYPERKDQLFYFTQTNAQQITYFKNRYLTYLVTSQLVKAASYDFISRVNDLLNHLTPEKKSYTTEKDAPNLITSYGPGVMIINMPSIPMLFFEQVMRPLYLFILFSCSLWVYQKYYYYSGVIFLTALVGVITNLIQTYQNNKRIYEMAYHEEKMNVMRSGEIVQLSSAQLAPGDIVFLKNQIKIPFDGIILQGQALINECALTGESVPVLKKPQKIHEKSDIKTSYIYEGTSLIQVGNKKKMVKFEHYRQKYGVPVIVARTNFSTMKGQLIRVISFPKERENIFEKQSAKFLIFLFCLSVASYGILIAKLHKYADAHTLIIKFLDLITITVPPGLPVSMTFGIIFALEKMKNKKIYCSSPNKVILGGMTNWICFDKTGTLTEDFMDFNCLLLYDGKGFSHPIVNSHDDLGTTQDEDPVSTQPVLSKNKHLIQIIEKNKNISLALNNMAMNHTIVNVEQTKENVGDPMEIKLFEFGNFYFSNENNDNADIIMSFDSERGHKGSVFKRFDFDSQLFRMSALGKSNITGNDFYLYTKGSPELMIQIFRKQTVPENYWEVLKQYTSQGFRVLAIGSKKIEQSQINSPRLQLEKDLLFNGFEVFENRLKPETKGAIKQLNQSEIPCVMITGDNALTGSNMACQCRISDPTKKTIICNFNPQKKQFTLEDFIYKPKEDEIIQPRKEPLQIAEENETIQKLMLKQPQPVSLKVQNQMIDMQEHNEIEKDVKMILDRLKDPNVQLCITGSAMNRIFDPQSKNLSKTEQYILLRTTVFARAKPNDKIKAISYYQNLGKKVAMCGDGANDCGALKQADIGLSLSMAEASISAPFTSQVTNVGSMVELIKECRSGLATNFSLFNIMALYSLIQYTTTIITQYYFSYPGDFHYLYWDIFCNFIFFLTIGYTKTADKLSKQIPSGSLFTVSNLLQVLLAFGLQLTGQFLMIVGLTQIFTAQMEYSTDLTYNSFQQEGQEFVLSSYENNSLFLFSNIMYIMTLLAFSISKPWRKEFYTNPFFVIALVLILTYSLVMIVVPGSRLALFEIQYMDYARYNWYNFGLALGLGVFIYIEQKFIVEPIFYWLKNKYPKKEWI